MPPIQSYALTFGKPKYNLCQIPRGRQLYRHPEDIGASQTCSAELHPELKDR